MLRDPVLYSVGVDYLDDDPSLIHKLADIVHTAAAMLGKGHLIKLNGQLDDSKVPNSAELRLTIT